MGFVGGSNEKTRLQASGVGQGYILQPDINHTHGLFQDCSIFSVQFKS